ncbi:AAA family ATPase [Hazenella sp. IB182353]|uniref:uridine kinase family protein n=1 Tax=Polycladospora coralii TaxID=2771432 RepID=UPI001745FEB2|nr:AAA family ATPase [Polycladospora coralii]MBS7528892.1 AAA family ATPase [Polycladospora coralii]
MIGIDGCGGAGKSTLASHLQEQLPAEVTIVHQDDFYLTSHQRKMKENNEPGSDFDWRRVRSQILHPLSQNREGYYQRYDWESDQLAEWYKIPIGGIVIVEGVYATRNELAHFYDFRIWIETPHDVRLRRGLTRDGEDARVQWEKEWMPAEEQYAMQQKPYEQAHLILDGTGKYAAFSNREWFLLNRMGDFI